MTKMFCCSAKCEMSTLEFQSTVHLPVNQVGQRHCFIGVIGFDGGDIINFNIMFKTKHFHHLIQLLLSQNTETKI